VKETTSLSPIWPLATFKTLKTDRYPFCNWLADGAPWPCRNPCPSQAFRKGPNLLGVQFHVEPEPQRIEAWLIGHTVELGKAKIDPSAIRQGAGRFGKRLQQIGRRIFNEWLDQIEQ
jgi:hypothetical protein